MFDLRKLFARDPRRDPDSDYHPSDRRGEGVEAEYQALLANQFRRWGISNACVTIEVRKIGQAPDGFDVLVGMVRLNHYERETALRLLVGLPLLEHRVRKQVRSTWMADFSHFGGLWLHASEQLQAEGVAELRDTLLQLVPPQPPSTAAGAAQHEGDSTSASSLAGSSLPSPGAAPDTAGGPVSATPLPG